MSEAQSLVSGTPLVSWPCPVRTPHPDAHSLPLRDRPADTLSYIYVNVAIMSLGHIAYPLSPRNNAIVTAHLLEATGTTRVFVSEDAAMQGLARAAADILWKKDIRVQMFNMPRPEDHAQGNAHPGLVDINEQDTTIILHSSGTTALPKPIRITRRGLVNLSNIPCECQPHAACGSP